MILDDIFQGRGCGRDIMEVRRDSVSSDRGLQRLFDATWTILAWRLVWFAGRWQAFMIRENEEEISLQTEEQLFVLFKLSFWICGVK